MIQVNHLRKEYGGTPVVEDVSFQLVPGEILGFLGPNGAGKSTTMKMLTGFLPPTSGDVKIWGCDIDEDRLIAQSHIGYLPEGAPCYEEMTPSGFLKFIAEVRGFRGPDIDRVVGAAVETLSLQEVMGKKIETLSKGYKRRVGLAQAILHDPDVLILDEPTDGLDPNQKYQVRELIKGLSKDKIVIISTHILEEVTAVCNRVMVLSKGNIVVDTTPTELQMRSRYHGAVTVTVTDRDSAARVAELLGDLTGAGGVAVDDCEVSVFLDDGANGEAGSANLSQQVIHCLDENSLAFEAIAVETGRLDEVFRELTEGEAA